MQEKGRSAEDITLFEQQMAEHVKKTLKRIDEFRVFNGMYFLYKAQLLLVFPFRCPVCVVEGIVILMCQ